MIQYNLFSVLQTQSLVRPDLCKVRIKLIDVVSSSNSVKIFLCRSTFSIRAYSTVNMPPAHTSDAIYWPEDGLDNLDDTLPPEGTIQHISTMSSRFPNGRYRVIHKLGYGSYSTVWLARDQEENWYVALKIATAEVYKKSIESKILQHLRAGKSQSPWM